MFWDFFFLLCQKCNLKKKVIKDKIKEINSVKVIQCFFKVQTDIKLPFCVHYSIHKDWVMCCVISALSALKGSFK